MNEILEKSSTSILIIDDSKFLNNSLKTSFEERGYVVEQAFDLATAQSILEETCFDFCLLDLELPDGRGEDLLPYLQVHESLRVIVFTNSRDKQRRQEIFKFGNVVDYIVKERYFADMELAVVRLIEMITSNCGLNILIVDDSMFFRNQLRILLSKRNFSVYDANDGPQALKVLQENNVDAVILDLEMPGMDGNKLLGAIKKDKKNLFVPVMIVSGTSDPDKIAKVLKNGANDFVKKPFSEEELLLKIDKMMQDLKQQRLIVLQQEKLKQMNLDLEMANKKMMEVNEAKSEFLSMMSHEIRTPLNAILGFIQILKSMEENEEKFKYLDIVDKSSTTLTNTINDILDISKIESGNFTLEPISFHAKEEFDSVVELFSQNANHKHVILVNSVSNSLPEHIKGDILRIKQVLSNLLSNAIKFTAEGKKVEVIVEFDEKTSELCIKVKDEGIGIAKENIKNIMEAFIQADNSTTRKYGGTGLGLTISNKLVELLGGKLEVNSQLGVGSEFYFRVPVKTSIHHLQKNEVYDDSRFSGKQVLLVEDNEANQIFMEVLLKKLSIEYEIANDGIEAIDVFETKKFDLILMDENMPRMSGIEATKKILEIEKNKKLLHTPIVALTANALPDDKQRFLSAGMDEYMTKPVSIEKLVQVLHSYI